MPIGKTAIDALGLTTGGQAKGFLTASTPVDPSLSPGGSSSGSAVAVAAGITSVGLGSDTAGSVRIPATYCGIAALNPALARLRRDGMVKAMGNGTYPPSLHRRCPDGVDQGERDHHGEGGDEAPGKIAQPRVGEPPARAWLTSRRGALARRPEWRPRVPRPPRARLPGARTGRWTPPVRPSRRRRCPRTRP
jgi:hypothetical protein